MKRRLRRNRQVLKTPRVSHSKCRNGVSRRHKERRKVPKYLQRQKRVLDDLSARLWY